MLMYVLIGLCLVLTGIAGLQFTYMFWVERLYAERRRHIRDLEHKCRDLSNRLNSAESRIADASSRLEVFGLKSAAEDEVWADLIEDR